MSASTLRRIAPGRHEKRHVIVARRVGHTEADRHRIVKARTGRGATEIGTNVKNELVNSRNEIGFREQRPLRAAIRIRHERTEIARALDREAEEVDCHAPGRNAARNVENVCRESAHPVLVCTEEREAKAMLSTGYCARRGGPAPYYPLAYALPLTR